MVDRDDKVLKMVDRDDKVLKMGVSENKKSLGKIVKTIQVGNKEYIFRQGEHTNINNLPIDIQNVLKH